MFTFTSLLVVGSGGFIGAALRYSLSALAQLRTVPAFYATFSINILGSFALAFITARILGPNGTGNITSHLGLFLRVGLCGGFTTFSTFSLEALDMLHNGKMVQGMLYVIASCLCCILASALGIRLANP